VRLAPLTLARWATVAVLGLPLPALGTELPPLSPTEASLLKLACSWADGSRADVAKQKCGAPSELEWACARRGRFVERDGEWLVSLASPCIGGCSGVTFVARRTAGRWTRLYQDGGLVTDDCVTVRLADGRDRVACTGATGPHQGFMTEWLELSAFYEGAPRRYLLTRDMGGECWLPENGEKAEYVGDSLGALAGGTAASETALTVPLTVRRAGCDRAVEYPQKTAVTQGTFTLRFVKRGNDVVPDEATKTLLKRYGWVEG
jgi:hypothetical protein